MCYPKLLLFISIACWLYACNRSNANTGKLLPVKESGITIEAKKDSLNYHLNADSVIKANNIPKAKIGIEISKSNYTLQLVYNKFVIKTYPCVFGLNPIDDKKMEGDRCTPEGTFKVIMKLPKHEWYKFIWFDYPNADSWRKFKERKAKGEIPENASIGGKVGIHGVGNGDNRYDQTVEERNNWTWGCIHIKNKDLDEVFDIVNVGTKITIRH